MLADISGKGISGTLLMASLQALRGQYAETSADLVRVLHTLKPHLLRVDRTQPLRHALLRHV